MMIDKNDIIRTLDALANWQGSLSLTDKERVALTFAVEYIKKHEETFEWCHDCKEYDKKEHCCHRWTKVIRDTVEELEKDRPHGEWVPGREISQMWTGDKWVGIDYEDFSCSCCGVVVEESTKPEWNFCPDCGADMREGDEK